MSYTHHSRGPKNFRLDELVEHIQSRYKRHSMTLRCDMQHHTPSYNEHREQATTHHRTRHKHMPRPRVFNAQLSNSLRFYSFRVLGYSRTVDASTSLDTLFKKQSL